MAGKNDIHSYASLSRALDELDTCARGWHLVGLTQSFKNKLDMDAKTIVTSNKEKAQDGRAELTKNTKEWAKLSPPEKLEGMQKLVKQYQGYITEITRQLRFAEGCFLDLYRVLAEAPDPYPPMEAVLKDRDVVQYIKELNTNYAALQETLKNKEKDLSEMKDQEATIASLQQTIEEYKSQMDQAIQKAMEDKAVEMAEEKNTLIAKLRDRESNLAEQLRRFDQQYHLQHQLCEQAQDEVMAFQGKISEIIHMKEEAETLLAQENDRLQHKLAELEAENATLRRKLPDMCSLHEMLQYKELAAVEADKRVLSEEQLEEAKKAADDAAHRAEVLGTRVTEQESRIQTLSETIRCLRDRLAAQEAAGEQEWQRVSEAETAEQERTALLHKHQADEAQLAVLRVEVKELTERVRTLTSERDKLQASEAELQRIVDRLEDDLAQMAGTNDVSKDFNLQQVLHEEPPDALRVLTSQRDRYRQRVQHLEEAREELVRAKERQEKELEDLRADNVRLYERTRNMQTRHNEPMFPSGVDEGGELRYRRVYERTLDPFAELKGRPREDYKRMNPAERVTYTVSRFLLYNRYTRIGVFAYSLFLHAIVFAVLYKMVHDSHSMHLRPHNFHGTARF